MRLAARAGDDDLDAARCGGRRKFRQPRRRPMGRNDLLFVRHAKSLSTLSACCIVSQSDCEPMMMATSGAAACGIPEY